MIGTMETGYLAVCLGVRCACVALARDAVTCRIRPIAAITILLVRRKEGANERSRRASDRSEGTEPNLAGTSFPTKDPRSVASRASWAESASSLESRRRLAANHFYFHRKALLQSCCAQILLRNLDALLSFPQVHTAPTV